MTKETVKEAVLHALRKERNHCDYILTSSIIGTESGWKLYRERKNNLEEAISRVENNKPLYFPLN